MECRVKPYDGDDAKAAIIHINDDDAVVFPFIERLNKCGLRVWHDSEIRKVMVEYKRNWKKQQAECAAYIVFLTQSAVDSHVFRERLTNAVESRKPFIVINTMEKNALSVAMLQQMERASRVILSSYIPRDQLIDEVVKLQVLKECVGKPNSDMQVSAYPNELKNSEQKAYTSPVRSIPPSERTMLELKRTHSSAVSEPVIPSDTKMSIQSEPKVAESSITSSPKTATSLEETIRCSDNDSSSAIDLESTVVVPKVDLPVIVSFTSGEKKKGMLGESVVGRAKKLQGSVADISFNDDCKLFSGKHFSLIYIDNICMLICKHPNGMNVDGQEMHEGDKYTVESEAVVQIPSNKTLAQLKDVRPTYLLVATSKRAKELWEAKAVAFLRATATGEIRCFTDQFSFGRGNAWRTPVMTSRIISRNHGDIILDSDHFKFQDHSTNGTMINGTKISNETMDLKNEDSISVQGDDGLSEIFVFHSCFFEKG